MKLRFLALATLLAVNLFAQSYYGGLGGTVLDQNGGALSGAKVTLINEGTNAQRSTVTLSAGEFVFSELIPGINDFFHINSGGQEMSPLGWARVHIFGLIPDPGWACFAYSVSYTAVCFIPVWILYRKKIFIKV